MIEIFELTDKRQIEQTAKEFKLEVSPLDRVFLMQENGDIGMGILGLEKGTVIIKEIFVAKEILGNGIQPFQYFDLLARSLLGVINNFSPIKVRIKKYDEYFEKFGFIKTESRMEIMSDRIVFNKHCKN